MGSSPQVPGLRNGESLTPSPFPLLPSLFLFLILFATGCDDLTEPVAVTPGNLRPAIVTELNQQVNEDGSLTIEIEANDPKGESMTLHLGDLPEHGTLETAAQQAARLATKTARHLARDTLRITSRGVLQAEAKMMDGPAFSKNTASATLVGRLIYTPNEHFHGTDRFTFSVRNASGFSSEAEVLLTINAEPDAPVVASVIPTQALAVGGIPFSVDLETIFSDPDGDPLTFASESSDAGIAEAVTNDNILVVTARNQGTATITVRAADPGGLSATTTFSVTGGGNRCPVRQGMIDAQILDVGATPFVVEDLNTFFSDPDGNPLFFSTISTNEQIVTAEIMGSQLTVTKVGIGLAAITIIARDGVCTADEPIAFTVTDSNAPEIIDPISDQDLVVGASFVIDDLNTVFQSPDNSPLTFEASSSMEQVATVSLEGPQLTVSALTVGQTLITVSASKADGRTIQDQFVVNVTAANHPPVSANDTYDVERGGTRFVSAEQGVLANDSDPDGDNISASIVSSVSHGTLDFDADGSFIYTHDGSNTSTDAFTYRVSDGAATSNLATVTFSIFEINTNEPPEAMGDSYALLRGTTRSVNSAEGVLANDSDPDGDALTAMLVTNVSHGTLAFDDDGSFTYTHDGSAGNTDSFTYRASDGTEVSNTATVTFIIQTS
ncbi:MAG TPA: Ig-like domain-containing protein, partial [Rhodothermales bacterium]|nr:Ig-like domain-containing protein [Rhodothermales bacterium]